MVMLLCAAPVTAVEPAVPAASEPVTATDARPAGAAWMAPADRANKQIGHTVARVRSQPPAGSDLGPLILLGLIFAALGAASWLLVRGVRQARKQQKQKHSSTRFHFVPDERSRYSERGTSIVRATRAIVRKGTAAFSRNRR